MPESLKPRPSRRGFMLGAAAAGAATAAVVTLPLSEPAEAPVTEKRPAPEGGGGYHLSEHIKRYYKTTLV
ncbi:twin-arginine translocation signal domain-containing protein [Ramlibacter sp. PS3R-8]|uniref:twin-arginine translocation signal domain-containing protein n=1 Tax=Ramlibacter sp. PS3R-8 TaxID=3133437 RepID=UPI0030AF8F15